MRTKANLLRKLVGLPPKKQTRTYLRRKSNYRKDRNSTRSVRKKRSTKFEQGLQAAQRTTKSWNSQPNPLQVYVFDRRVHHGELGFVAGLAGILKNDPYWIGLGTGLVLDDLHDAKEWFTFKKRESLPTLSYNSNFA